MVNDEQNFIKEYEGVISARRGMYGADVSFDFATVPVLPLEFKMDGTDNGWGYVTDISEPEFQPLEKQYVELLKGSTFEHRVSYNGDWVKDSDGNIRIDTVRVPSDCVAIRTSKKLVIRLVDENGNRIKQPDDYGVIDFEEDEYNRPVAYKYFIPKACVHRTNPLALCVAKNTHGKVFYGRAIRMQNGEEIYLYVIPYSKSSESEGTNKRIISIKMCDGDPRHAFDKEIAAICKFWQGGIVSLPNISLVSFVKAYTRYFDAVKNSKNDKIRARGALRLPRCRILFNCLIPEGNNGNETVSYGYCDMYGTKMMFSFFVNDSRLRKFYWDFGKPVPKQVRNIRIVQIGLERIGVQDGQEHLWMPVYLNKFNMLRQSGQCYMCRTGMNYSKIACGRCNMCANEERMYFALFNDEQQSQTNIRWFSSITFNPSVMGLQSQTKYGANLVAREIEGISVEEYTAISSKSLAEE